MKLINPSVELIQQQPGLVGMYKHIEKCARTCYKTEDSITENSYKNLEDIIFNQYYDIEFYINNI